MKNIFLIYILIFISIIYLSSCQIDVKEKINKKDFNLSETENIEKRTNLACLPKNYFRQQNSIKKIKKKIDYESERR